MYQFNTTDNPVLVFLFSCRLHKYNFRKQDILSFDLGKITIV